MPEKITKEDKEKFKQYVVEAEPCLDQLRELFGEYADRLDFTPESLSFVGEAILAQKENKTRFEDSWYIVRLAYYLAETVKKNLGGEWVLQDNPEISFFGAAVFICGPGKYMFSPLWFVNEMWKNGQGTAMFTYFQNLKKMAG